MEFRYILHDLLQRVLSKYIQLQEFLKKVCGVPQTLGLKTFPCFLAHHLPFHIMVVMVVLGVLRHWHLEKFGCDKTILIWVKCVDHVTRFELFSQEFRHIDFVVVPSAICAPHLIQLGNFPLLGATAPNSIPKVHLWKHCPRDFATAYVTWEKTTLSFCPRSTAVLTRSNHFWNQAQPQLARFPFCSHRCRAFALSLSVAFPKTMWLFIASALFLLSDFSSSVHMCFTSWRYPRSL